MPADVAYLGLVQTDNGALASTETGEVFAHPLEAELAAVRAHLRNAEEELRRYRAKVKKLEADAQHERNVYVMRHVVQEIFDYWRARCAHPRSKLTPDRFDAVKGALEHGYTPEQIRLAIDGAHLEPFTRSLRNGRIERYDDLELICRTGAKLESFARRAPRPAQGRLL